MKKKSRSMLAPICRERLIIRKICVTSFACPSLGIKCDAYPGRLNQVSVFTNRVGVFYGLEQWP